jgi:RNA polymerase sigma-70 factor (ECF subfamily)
VNESELVVRARNGDQMAWAQLIQVHQEPVFRLVYLILGNAQDAEDVAQETFLRAFRALDRFDDTYLLRPWLLQIARNLAYNRRRSLQRYWRAVNRLWTGEQQGATSLEDVTSRSMQAQALWQAVQNLKRQDQEVIYLRYFLELSVAETADALNVAEGTVKSRLARALARLKPFLTTDDPTWEVGR